MRASGARGANVVNNLPTLQHAASVLNTTEQLCVLRYFVERGVVAGHVPGETFEHALQLARCCAADVILALLRMHMLPQAQAVWGRTVQHVPPCWFHTRGAPRRAAKTADERRVTHVRVPAPREHGRRRLLGTPLYQQLQQVRPGTTVAAVLARGATRAHLRLWLRRGYVQLEAQA